MTGRAVPRASCGYTLRARSLSPRRGEPGAASSIVPGAALRRRGGSGNTPPSPFGRCSAFGWEKECNLKKEKCKLLESKEKTMSVFPPEVKMMLLHPGLVLPGSSDPRRRAAAGRSLQQQGAGSSARAIPVLGLRAAGFHPRCWEHGCASGSPIPVSNRLQAAFQTASWHSLGSEGSAEFILALELTALTTMCLCLHSLRREHPCTAVPGARRLARMAFFFC